MDEKKRLKKPKFEESDLGLNPCVSSRDFLIPVRKRKHTSKVYDVNDISEGVITGSAQELQSSYYVEDCSVTKLYTSASFRVHVCGISPKSCQLMLWLMYKLEDNKDWVWINYIDYMNECSVSYNTYKEAVKELVMFNIIYLTLMSKDHVYWINPIFFFRGNRIIKYSDKIVER